MRVILHYTQTLNIIVYSYRDNIIKPTVTHYYTHRKEILFYTLTLKDHRIHRQGHYCLHRQ